MKDTDTEGTKKVKEQEEGPEQPVETKEEFLFNSLRRIREEVTKAQKEAEAYKNRQQEIQEEGNKINQKFNALNAQTTFLIAEVKKVGLLKKELIPKDLQDFITLPEKS